MKILYGFRESKIFTRNLSDLLPENEYFELQEILLSAPESGKLIKGGKGIRKIRWIAEGRGKRGGTRIIYYFATAKEKFFMLDIYAKNEKEDLTEFELKSLRNLVEGWLSQ